MKKVFLTLTIAAGLLTSCSEDNNDLGSFEQTRKYECVFGTIFNDEINTVEYYSNDPLDHKTLIVRNETTYQEVKCYLTQGRTTNQLIEQYKIEFNAQN